MSEWTVATRPAGSDEPLIRTGFVGTWGEASDMSLTLSDEFEVWVVDADCLSVVIEWRDVGGRSYPLRAAAVSDPIGDDDAGYSEDYSCSCGHPDCGAC